MIRGATSTATGKNKQTKKWPQRVFSRGKWEKEGNSGNQVEINSPGSFPGSPCVAQLAVKLSPESRKRIFGANVLGGFWRPAWVASKCSWSDTPLWHFHCGALWALVESLGADFGAGFWVRSLVRLLGAEFGADFGCGFWRRFLARIVARIVQPGVRSLGADFCQKRQTAERAFSVPRREKPLLFSAVPLPQRAQILKNFRIWARDWNFQARLKRLKFSTEIESFQQATHQTPIFVGNFQAFKRDCFFSRFGPSGCLLSKKARVGGSGIGENNMALIKM